MNWTVRILAILSMGTARRFVAHPDPRYRETACVPSSAVPTSILTTSSEPGSLLADSIDRPCNEELISREGKR